VDDAQRIALLLPDAMTAKVTRDLALERQTPLKPSNSWSARRALAVELNFSPIFNLILPFS
jgi:hypothetical protein